MSTIYTSLSLLAKEWTSKWGQITIFTGANYPQFAITCKAALVAAEAWDIVSGEEPELANGGAQLADWKKEEALLCS